MPTNQNKSPNQTTRRPYQVLVFPYVIDQHNEINYALFQRRDSEFWQGIAGGGDVIDKTVLDTAKREAFEEAGISSDHSFMKLNSVSSIPVTSVSGFIWGEDVLVIPEYSFAVLIKDKSLQISHEHIKYNWFSYTQAHKLLKWDSNKTALWELDQQLHQQLKETS